MSEKLQNVDDITRGAIAVIVSLCHPKDEKGLTVNQAAQMLGMSTAKLSQMRHTKTGPEFYRDGSGKVLYAPSSIREFIKSNSIQSNTKRRVA